GDRAGVEMVTPNHDRPTELPSGHQLVEAKAREVALAVAEPADAGREPLKLHLLARQADPARDVLLIAEQLQNRLVRAADVGGIAGQGHPPKRALALAEE